MEAVKMCTILLGVSRDARPVRMHISAGWTACSGKK